MATTPEKKALFAVASEARRRIRGDTRRAATEAAVERAAAVIRGWAGPIALYAAIRDELNPARLAEILHAEGRVLALPCTPVWGRPLVFRRWAPGDALVRGRMNVPEPTADAEVVVPAIAVAPPVAFDRRCFRIGYGAGFYDRTLAALRSAGAVRAIGIAFAAQEVDRVPDEPHDIPLDAIATERELILPTPG
jgi:5-formyltetrahydrofolate cyclo-ligase